MPFFSTLPTCVCVEVSNSKQSAETGYNTKTRKWNKIYSFPSNFHVEKYNVNNDNDVVSLVAPY